jgi:uncharacterized protein YegP (UPF0339 family)
MKRSLLFILLLFALAIAGYGQTRAGHFDIEKTGQGKFYFVLRSSNGQEILKGYQFGSQDKAADAIAKVKQQAAGDANFDLRDENGQFYFFLKGPDGKAIGRSENYSTDAARKRGIESVKRTAPDAEVRNRE